MKLIIELKISVSKAETLYNLIQSCYELAEENDRDDIGHELAEAGVRMQEVSEFLDNAIKRFTGTI